MLRFMKMCICIVAPLADFPQIQLLCLEIDSECLNEIFRFVTYIHRKCTIFFVQIVYKSIAHGNPCVETNKMRYNSAFYVNYIKSYDSLKVKIINKASVQCSFRAISFQGDNL